MANRPEPLFRIFSRPSYSKSGGSTSESKITIDELITLPLASRGETYPKHITWKELSETKGLEPTDIIHDIDYIEQKGGGFGWMGPVEPPVYLVPHILVSRQRIETDDEYVKRIRENQAHKTQAEKQERELYLKLHAKYGIEKA